jgi:hypothetical protein
MLSKVVAYSRPFRLRLCNLRSRALYGVVLCSSVDILGRTCKFTLFLLIFCSVISHLKSSTIADSEKSQHILHKGAHIYKCLCTTQSHTCRKVVEIRLAANWMNEGRSISWREPVSRPHDNSHKARDKEYDGTYAGSQVAFKDGQRCELDRLLY